MKYGNTDLKVILKSLSFVVAKSQEIRHYPGTDEADAIENGKLPTKIKCTLKAIGTDELILVQQILHTSDKKELHFNDIYYKKVASGQQGKPKPLTADEKVWLIDAEFVALDPIPYDIDTGEALY